MHLRGSIILVNTKFRFSTLPLLLFTLFALLSLSARTIAQDEPNFTTGEQTARLFGVHEVTLTGDGSVENPFDTAATVTFVSPSGDTKQVYMFYDGGDVWKARVYVTEAGAWTWQSESQADAQLNGQSGAFTAVESDLRGMLKPDEHNPKQWQTDNGVWFLNISDTAYRLFNMNESLWQEYVREDDEMGITSIRAGGLGGYAWPEDADSSNYPWDGEDLTRYNLEKFQTTDTRLQWMLNEYPDMYIQMITFGQISWQTDEVGTAWKNLPDGVRENTMRYMVARWAAYPQIFWLGINDLGCSVEYPNNREFGREVGRYLAENDPWKHMVSVSNTGRANPFCYLDAEDADWVGYLHIQAGHALGAAIVNDYKDYPLHVFLGEDYYEQDNFTQQPRNMVYSQRWLFWSWLLAGGSANYGGRYPVLHPYKQSGTFEFHFEDHDYGALTGLDSAPFIKSYFADRQIDLYLFEPDDSLIRDINGKDDAVQHPELMRRGKDEFLIYHPNALQVERFATPNPNATPGVIFDMREIKAIYSVEWYRPKDGAVKTGSHLLGGRYRRLRSPWQGDDVVLRLVRISDDEGNPIP